MTTRTIKDIDNRTWLRFRSLAVRNKTTAGALFKRLVDEHERQSTSAWETILKHKPLLDKEEAAAMLDAVRTSRKEYGFRT